MFLLCKQGRKMPTHNNLGGSKMSKKSTKTLEVKVLRSILIKDDKKTKKAKKIIQSILMKTFQEALDESLEKLAEFSYFSVKMQKYSLDEWKVVAEKNGFVLLEPIVNDVLYLGVKASKKGKKISNAEVMLQRFRRKLQDARRKRTDVLLTEFMKIIRIIDEGKYESISNNVISVASEVEIKNKFEEESVCVMFLTARSYQFIGYSYQDCGRWIIGK